ncbi:MAG TPA: carboxypeptidase regulatory-like domain-containing protein [Terriglobales bacterium]|nr:carboxypeptidase regulatory-like domain-containing protein [Terriglobales bacterium]
MGASTVELDLAGPRNAMRALYAVGVGIAFLLVCLPMFGQTDRGRILGNVHDSTGAVIVGAKVTITDVQRGVSRNLITDSAGAFSAPGLTPGTYEVRVQSEGFKAEERQNILLEVGQDVRVDVGLQPGQANQTVTVSSEIPLVNTINATLGGTVDNKTINELPLNGRNYQNLLSLRPGVVVYAGGGPWTQVANGIRPEDTGYVVDGVSDDEAFMGLSVTNAAAVAGDAATLLPIDAIQEFNVEENPSAEFGWKPGAITSVGLKSGTNQLHGTAYGFGRSDSFDARNFFNRTPDPKTPVSLEQYGGTLGGHIVKDKLFYFGAYEGQRYTVGNALNYSLPTTASLATPSNPAGDPTSSIPDAERALGMANVSPVSLKLLPLYGPNDTQGTSITRGFNNVNASNNALGKIDYHINDRHTLSGSYFFGNDKLVAEDSPETQAFFLTQIHSRAQTLSAHETWVANSRLVNDLRFGYTRYTLSIAPSDQNTPPSAYGLNTGITNPVLGGLPGIKVTGFTELGGFPSFPKYVGPDNTLSFMDNISYLRGKHALKFGGELRDLRVHQGTWRKGRGEFRFNSLEDFLSGTPNRAILLAGVPTRDLSQWEYSGFFQDDWRATRKVTINLGLRYEYDAPPTEAHNLLGNFEPGVGLEQVGKNISSIYKPDHKNFSPRVGFAWDVTGNGTTVVRAGGSLIYDVLTMNSFLSQQNTQNAITLGLGVIPTGAPQVVNGVTQPGPGNILASAVTVPGSSLNWNGSAPGGATVFPSNVTSLLQCGDGLGNDPGPCDIMAMDRNYRSPYVTNWTLGIEHAFSGNVSWDVSYVGNHGSKLSGIYDINQINPQSPAELACGHCEANADRPYAAQFPYLEFINFLTNVYRSNYNGLQTTLNARNLHGLTLITGYTYSHALDNMSYNWNQYLPQNSMAPRADYGNSDFDLAHRFTLSLTYALPSKKSPLQLLEGWQLNSIVTLQSGMPWQTFDSANDLSATGEFADRWNFSGNPADFKSGGPNPIPCFGFGGTTGCSPNIPGPCMQAAQAMGSGAVASLNNLGCYMAGNSVMTPPALGTFGNLGRNVFRDTGFRNLDLSVAKNFRLKERLTAQFRAEFFNVLNHPNFANPWGGTSGYGPGGGFSDPSAPGSFGCACGTPDTAAVNPVLGSGGARAIQLGLKMIF